jgi:hypothetical protein
MLRLPNSNRLDGFSLCFCAKTNIFDCVRTVFFHAFWSSSLRVETGISGIVGGEDIGNSINLETDKLQVQNPKVQKNSKATNHRAIYSHLESLKQQ